VREPEFLPNWYSHLLARRRFLSAQGWVTALFCAFLAGWAIVGMRRTQAAQTSLAAVTAQLGETGVDLQRLHDLSVAKAELQRRQEIVNGLGVNVPVSRMLAALDQLMPQRMALETMTLQTEESKSTLTDAEKAKGVAPTLTRKLRLTLTGVAPSHDDLSTFMTELENVPYFSEVELTKADDSQEHYHLVRKFEVKFAMSLDGETAHPGTVAGIQDTGGR